MNSNLRENKRHSPLFYSWAYSPDPGWYWRELVFGRYVLSFAAFAPLKQELIHTWYTTKRCSSFHILHFYSKNIWKSNQYKSADNDCTLLYIAAFGRDLGKLSDLACRRRGRCWWGKCGAGVWLHPDGGDRMREREREREKQKEWWNFILWFYLVQRPSIS